MTRFAVVLVTASSAAEARKLARALVAGKLAACVNVVPGVESHYWWKGKIETGRERLLIVKTARARVPAVIRCVKSNHSYSVPEVIALPIDAGPTDYLRWLGDSLR